MSVIVVGQETAGEEEEERPGLVIVVPDSGLMGSSEIKMDEENVAERVDVFVEGELPETFVLFAFDAEEREDVIDEEAEGVAEPGRENLGIFVKMMLYCSRGGCCTAVGG